MYFDQKMTGGFSSSPVIRNVTCHSRFSPVIMAGTTCLAQTFDDHPIYQLG